MEKVVPHQSCGFGKKRRTHFGSEYTSFFQKDKMLTPEIKNCLNAVYYNNDKGYGQMGSKSSFGSRLNKIKEINGYIRYLKQ